MKIINARKVANSCFMFPIITHGPPPVLYPQVIMNKPFLSRLPLMLKIPENRYNGILIAFLYCKCIAVFLIGKIQYVAHFLLYVHRSHSEA